MGGTAGGRSGGTHGPEGHLSRWRLYFDGASRGNPGLAGAGAVLCDPQGEPAAQRSCFLGLTTNNVAEYQGLLLGLKLAREQGVAHLEIVSDSELVVKQIKGEYRVKSPHLAPLWLAAKTELNQFKSYTIRHTPREHNHAADKLANEAIDRGTVEE